MKKTFELTHPKIKAARMVDTVKHEVKKYVKRERKKSLPAGVDFWDFDCQFGNTESEKEVVHLSGINQKIDDAVKLELTSFYIEIIVKEGFRSVKPLADDEDLDDEYDEELEEDDE
ncbi:MAG: restriction endonuclease Mrr [Alteromonadaceae bacterium]|jgi:restriction endonuclease Mrr